MKYEYLQSDLSLKERILDLNDIDINSLDIDNLNIDLNDKVLVNFKEKLLSNKDKRFLIVGDYDCDGICATAIMKRLLDYLNIRNNYYIPSRTKEGYGLNEKIVKTAIDNHFDCILTVDNGVSSLNEIKICKENNIKVFIIDHHNYEGEIDVEAFIHPKLLNDDIELSCGAGLSALFSMLFYEDDLSICYGGLATLADMVPVFKFNRYLLKRMMNILKNKNIYTINNLLGSKELTYQNLAFNVIPKINAVSRLEEYMNVNLVVRYLLASKEDAYNYYEKIELINIKRVELTRIATSKALRFIKEEEPFNLIILDDINEGLCGLIANKLLAESGKPTMVLKKTIDEYKGSARGPKGFDLYNYFSVIKDNFKAFGGHKEAIGISIDENNIEVLKTYIKDNPPVYEEVINKVLVVDKFDLDDLNVLNDLAPFGMNFKEPLFAIKNNNYSYTKVGSKGFRKYKINSYTSAISFKLNLNKEEFKYLIGRFEKDNYYLNRLSFLIEDLD